MKDGLLLGFLESSVWITAFALQSTLSLHLFTALQCFDDFSSSLLINFVNLNQSKKQLNLRNHVWNQPNWKHTHTHVHFLVRFLPLHSIIDERKHEINFGQGVELFWHYCCSQVNPRAEPSGPHRQRNCQMVNLIIFYNKKRHFICKGAQEFP